MSVRKIRANYRSVTGLVADDQSARSTAYESSLERDFIKHLLFNQNVLEHEEQPLTIDFTDPSGIERRYTPDLLVSYRKDIARTRNWQPLLAEVKYRSDLFEHWAELKPKFRATRAYARERSWAFAVITERELRTSYLKNITFLLEFRKHPVDDVLNQRLLEAAVDRSPTTPAHLLTFLSVDSVQRAMLAFLTLCPLHKTLLLERCQSCGMAVSYERQTTEEAGTRWLLTQCYKCKIDLRKFAAPRYRTPVDSAELEFAMFLQTALQRGWVELPQNEVYSQLFFTGLHQIMRRLSYGRMAQTLKAALYRSFAIELPIDYLPAKSVIFERLNILQRRPLLHALDRLLQNWPDSFIEFCQVNNLASHFLIGDQLKDLPFWYLQVIGEHLTKGAHKVSDEEIISIVNYVRKEEGQSSARELNQFLSQQIITRARRAGLIMGKQYPGLCRHCQATQRQFKSGLSRYRTQQFRCGECGRKYQQDYVSNRTRNTQRYSAITPG